MADNKNTPAPDVEAMRRKMAELEADNARLRQETDAMQSVVARKDAELRAATALLEEDKPLVERFGRGKIIAADGCRFLDAELGRSVAAKKGDVINPVPEDLASLKKRGVVVET